MAKSIKKLLKSFTLIELIIVIAIIAVLGASAFLLLTQWMSKSRDSQRISDLATIKTALDIALTKNDELPLPDEAKELLYTGTEILYQGVFGDQVVKSIGTLNKVPKDRQTGEYEYSLLYDKKSYRIKAVMENEQYQLSFLNQAKASDEVYRFVGKDIKAVTVGGMFVYLPSMFISGYNEEGKYDLYGTDMDVFVGNKVGEYKSGFALPVTEIDQIKSMLTQLGLEETQVNQVVLQGTGQPQIVVEEACDGTLPVNSVMNGTVKSGLSWTYNETAGECVYKCKDYYEYTGGECLSTLFSGSIVASDQWTFSGTNFKENQIQLSTMPPFMLDQELPHGGGRASKYFEIDGKSYLATIRTYNGTTNSLNSYLYERINGVWTKIQDIATVGGVSVDVTVIDGKTYMIIGNSSNGTSYSINSKLYVWNGIQFDFVHNILTYDVRDVKFFQMDGITYLGVMNRYDGTTFSLNSKIFKWSGSSFVLFQNLATTGGFGFDYTEFDNKRFVAAINSSTTTYNLTSKIYTYNGTTFQLLKNISTSGGRSPEFFNIGTNHYFMVTNYYDGTTYSNTLDIYKWNGTTYEIDQTINTVGNTDSEITQIGSDYYLFLAGFFDGTDHSLSSKVYKRNGTSFVLFHSIPSVGNIENEYFQINGESYILYNQYRNGDNFTIKSKIYKYVNSFWINDYQIAKSPVSQRISLTTAKKIISVTVNQTQPSSTNVKYLVSFDAGLTYKTKVNGTWELATSSEIETKGMSDTQLKSALEGYEITNETSLDLIVGVNSTISSTTPAFQAIKIDYQK